MIHRKKFRYFTCFVFFLSISFVYYSCSKLPSQDAEARTIYEVSQTVQKILSEYENTKLAGMGYIDVTSPPYDADPTGNIDATEAIQQALKDARDARMICYLPAGQYLVSNTITGIQGTIKREDWPYVGFSDPWLENASFEYPNVLMGPFEGERAIIVLKDNASGFADPENPKPVIHFWARMEYGKIIDKTRSQPNINFNQKILNIDFYLGNSNQGAIAITHQGAEGSVIENVNIKAFGAFAGIQNAPGSGGGIHGISVEGGRFGLYIRNPEKNGSQPAPVVSGLKLKNQTKNSILYDGRGPLTVVGANITGAGILAESTSSAKWNGSINIIDAVIEVTNNDVAIESNRSVVLDNVFIKNAETAIHIKDQSEFPGNKSGWLHFKRYAAGSIHQKAGEDNSSTIDHVWLNGKTTTDQFAEFDQTPPHDPEELIGRHSWPEPFPSIFSINAVNVKDYPYLAKGNGITDDAKAIQKAIDENEIVFLPKGIFAISKPLKLKSNTKLIGLGNVQTVITTTRESNVYTDPDNPLPLIETVDDANAETILGFIKLLVPVKNPCVYALNWKAGRRSIVRNVYPIREEFHPHGISMSHPMVKIDGSGGGKWYNTVLLHWWCQGPDYRHLLVDNSYEPLKFYMLEPQHTRSEFMVEINNSRNFEVFAVKSEGDNGVIHVNNCYDFRIFGYAGNGMPNHGHSIIKIENSDDFLIANFNPQHKREGHYGALGIYHDPTLWNILNFNNYLKLNGTEQFAYFLQESSNNVNLDH